MGTIHYNSNSWDVMKINFNYIKSMIEVKQTKAYDVSLADFRFENLKKNQYLSATHASSINTLLNNKPILKIKETQS